MMNHRPVFKRFYHPEVLPPHGVLLLSERGQFLLRGRAYLLVAPFLDGRHTVPEIVARLEGQLQEAEVLYAIDLLERRGYVTRTEAAPSSPDRQSASSPDRQSASSPDRQSAAPSPPDELARAAFWELVGVDPSVAAARLGEGTVAVRAFGDVSTAPFESMLANLGVRVASASGPTPRLTVALTDDHLQSGLRELGSQALLDRRPWLLVKAVGVEPWLGPMFVPGKTGCWLCLAHRLSGHRKAEAYFRTHRGLDGPLVLSRAALPTTVSAALSLAATEVARWLVQEASEALEGRVVTLDSLTLERRVHTLVRRPQCPSCGDPGLVARGQSRPIALAASPAVFTEEGGYRRMSPEEMLARNEHLVSPITGLVGHLKRLLHKSDTDLVPSYVADHNLAHVDEDLFFLEQGQRSHSGGKGKTDAQARASALGEAIERYSGLFQGDEARVRARMADLGEAAIHPNRHMLFSDRQLAERERWNRTGSHFTRTPAPFDPDRAVDWSPFFPLHGGEPRYLPTACCYFGYGRRQVASLWAPVPTAEPPAPALFANADSNGCAAGTTREEAVLQGLLELCERDATAIWWYNRVRRPGVDLSTFSEPYYDKVKAFYQGMSRDFWALDLTHDLGIPTFAALSRRTDKPAEDIIFGLGAHPDPKIAMLRAVTEHNQFLPAVFNVTRESEQYRWFDDGVRFFRTATLQSEPYLAPDPAAPLRTLADYHPPPSGSSPPSASSSAYSGPRVYPTGDLHQDILSCARAISEKGATVLVLDQTRPDASLAVVRVVAPGLRHFWARFAPGRLYDVPVQLGWLPRPLTEDELNPIPIFF